MSIRKRLKKIIFGSNKPQYSVPNATYEPKPEPKLAQVRDPSSFPTHRLALYGRSSCPYCVRVDRVVEQLGLNDIIEARLTTFGSKWRTDLKEKTGRTQVPCLFIDDVPMFESADIIAWLKKNYG